MRAALLFAFLGQAAAACTASDICTGAPQLYSPSSFAGYACFESASDFTLHGNQIDPTCQGCSDPQNNLDTETACTTAGKYWRSNTCAEVYAVAPEGTCSFVEGFIQSRGNSCCGAGGSSTGDLSGSLGGLDLLASSSKASCSTLGVAGLAQGMDTYFKANPQMAALDLDGTAIAQCICSDNYQDDFLSSLQTSSSDPSAIIQAMCTPDCKGLLEMVYAVIGQALTQSVAQQGPPNVPDASSLMRGMVDCMCENTAFVSLLSADGDGSAPTVKQMETFCGTPSCSNIINTLSAGQVTCADIKRYYRTKMTMTLSGAVSDYEGQVDTYKQRFATRFGVDVTAVTITLAPGSVVMRVTIDSSSDLSSQAAQVSTSADADALLGCSGCTTAPPQTSSEQVSGDDGLSVGAIVGIAVGSACGVLLLIALLYFLVKKKGGSANLGKGANSFPASSAA